MDRILHHKSDGFDSKDWIGIFLLDGSCAHSKQQLEMFKEQNINMKTNIDCSDPANKKTEVCQRVRAFPAVCHAETQQCVYGAHRSLDELKTSCTEEEKHVLYLKH